MSWEGSKQAVKNFLGQFFWTARVVTTLVAFSALIGSILSLRLIQTHDWLFLVGSVLLVIVAVITFLYRRRRLEVVGVPYRLAIRESRYEYKTRTTMEHIKRFKIVAKKDHVDRFVDRYLWSGSNPSPIQIQPLVPGHRVLNSWKEEIWNFYDIKFDHSLKCNEQVTTAIKMSLTDTAGTAQTYLMTGIYEPTDKLIMRVILPHNLIPANVFLSSYAHYTDTTPLNSLPGTYDYSEKQIFWEVNEPVLGGKYRISWSFESEVVTAEREHGLEGLVYDQEGTRPVARASQEGSASLTSQSVQADDAAKE